MHDETTGRSGRGWWYLLLLVPLITLWVPTYNTAAPSLAGFPFYYWYQLLWVFISAVITGIVYFVTR